MGLLVNVCKVQSALVSYHCQHCHSNVYTSEYNCKPLERVGGKCDDEQ